eukprot:Rhum_TRINITY_DN14813_c4_g2::Rhum_TRINITY_DN14813_c4_g2_i1::g.120469::m.120469
MCVKSTKSIERDASSHSRAVAEVRARRAVVQLVPRLPLGPLSVLLGPAQVVRPPLCRLVRPASLVATARRQRRHRRPVLHLHRLRRRHRRRHRLRRRHEPHAAQLLLLERGRVLRRLRLRLRGLRARLRLRRLLRRLRRGARGVLRVAGVGQLARGRLERRGRLPLRLLLLRRVLLGRVLRGGLRVRRRLRLRAARLRLREQPLGGRAGRVRLLLGGPGGGGLVGGLAARLVGGGQRLLRGVHGGRLLAGRLARRGVLLRVFLRGTLRALEGGVVLDERPLRVTLQLARLLLACLGELALAVGAVGRRVPRRVVHVAQLRLARVLRVGGRRGGGERRVAVAHVAHPEEERVDDARALDREVHPLVVRHVLRAVLVREREQVARRARVKLHLAAAEGSLQVLAEEVPLVRAVDLVEDGPQLLRQRRRHAGVGGDAGAARRAEGRGPGDGHLLGLRD